MRRLILGLTIVAGCSLLYDPRKLPTEPSDPVDARDDIALVDAAPSNSNDDATSPGVDAAGTDAAKPDARMPDAAMPDAAMPDAAMPDAAICGDTSQPCCAGMMCSPSNECGGGTCHHCGGVLESCCDPGMTCNGALSCIAGVCTL